MSIGRRGLLWPLGLLAMLSAGCSGPAGDSPIAPPPPGHRQSSPADCLENLMTAYNERNLDDYMRLFPPDFTFVFRQGGPIRLDNPIPPSWGLADERTATRNMFSDDKVAKIELSYPVGPATDSNDEFPGTWKIVQDKINLRLTTLKEDGTTLVLLVDGGHANFYFREYPDERDSHGNPLWRIWRWEDEPLAAKTLVMRSPDGE